VLDLLHWAACTESETKSWSWHVNLRNARGLKNNEWILSLLQMVRKINSLEILNQHCAVVGAIEAETSRLGRPGPQQHGFAAEC